MSNTFVGNPVILDTFSANIDLGMLMHGDSKFIYTIKNITWEIPNATLDTAVITNGFGIVVFNEVCTSAKRSIQKVFYDAKIQGIKIAAGAVESGQISILLG